MRLVARALFALLIAPCVAAYCVTAPLSFERSPARNPRGRGCCAPQMALESAMQVARGAVVEAAAVARFVAQSYSNFDALTIGKVDTSPVTVADFAVQAIVCKRLMDAFPDDRVIAEEAADELRANEDLCLRVLQAVRVIEPEATSDDICAWIDRGAERSYHSRFWTLDPIDGTKGFLRREQYAICCALLLDGIPSVGVLACPNLPLSLEDPASSKGALFSAYLGGGAWQAPMAQTDTAACQTDQESSPGPETAGAPQLGHTPIKLAETNKATSELRFCESVEAAHSNHEMSGAIGKALRLSRPPLRLDSQVLSACLCRCVPMCVCVFVCGCLCVCVYVFICV